ncbi:MAG: hypothetical protein LBK99_04955 [Opitutaceae bacterium]|jgi:hypothetical protein|nr:hypothetical protein [Opitutaceae bacterium]
MNIQIPHSVLRRSLALSALALFTALPAARALDLDTTTFAANFRKSYGTAISTWSNMENGGIGASTSNAVNGGYIYDTTPGDGTKGTQSTFTITKANSLTVSISLSIPTTNSSIGIYIVDPDNENTGYLALYNVNSSGTNDLIRFSTNATPSNGGAGSLPLGSTGSGLDLNETGTLVFTYGLNENDQGVMTLSMFNSGSATTPVHSDSFTMTGISNPLTTFEVSLRIAGQPGNGTYVLNHFSATVGDGAGAIPEPATVTLLSGAVAIIGVLIARRRATATATAAA